MDVAKYIQALSDITQKSAWQLGWLGKDIPYLHVSGVDGALRLYLSAGIHGDEPAGPMAILSMLKKTDFFDDLEVFLFPCLNPIGLAAGTRENGHGIDLNRNFGPNNIYTPETERHRNILKKMPPVDVAVCLHEDWEARGVYLYDVAAKCSQFQSQAVLNAMAQHLPVEKSEWIDGHEASGGIISRVEADYVRDDWPESIYLLRHLTQSAFTLETPSAERLELRIAAHEAAVGEIISQLRRS